MNDPTELRVALEDWVEQTLTNDAGVPPDAKLNMDWVGGPRGHLYGPIPEGQSEPSGGMRTRVIDLYLAFGGLTPSREIGGALDRLRRSLEGDPHLGGRMVPPDQVAYRGSKIEDTDDGDWLATLTVAHSCFE